MKKYAGKIPSSLLGLVISVLSILLHLRFGAAWVSVLCCAVCSVYGVLEVYGFWIKKAPWLEQPLAQIVVSFLFTLAYYVIVFTVLVVLVCAVLSLPFSIDLLLYTVFSFPSFVVVIAVILLLMSAASYA